MKCICSDSFTDVLRFFSYCGCCKMNCKSKPNHCLFSLFATMVTTLWLNRFCSDIVGEIPLGVTVRGEDVVAPLSDLYFVQVLISNGALNSTATEVSSTTWPLPPTPVVTGFTNTSLNITVPLDQTHFPLDMVYIEVCVCEGLHM